MESFRAYRIFEEDGRSNGRLVDMSTEELDAGEVLIRTAYSSVNFKDALTGTGAGKVVRRFPCVGGIDGCGTVVSSSDADGVHLDAPAHKALGLAIAAPVRTALGL